MSGGPQITADMLIQDVPDVDRADALCFYFNDMLDSGKAVIEDREDWANDLQSEKRSTFLVIKLNSNLKGEPTPDVILKLRAEVTFLRQKLVDQLGVADENLDEVLASTD